MTVENTNSKSGPYDLDGSTLRFPRDFFLERPEHVQVFQVIDGVATLLTTGFTVTGIGSDEGEVIFSAEGYPVGGGVLMLKRNVPNTQETDYSNQARVKPEQVEIDLDKIVRQIQDLREVVNRSLHISIDQDLSDADLDRMSRAVIALGEIRDELEALYGKIPELQAVYDELDEVTLAGRNIEAIKAFSGSVLSLVDKSFVATGGQTAFQLDVMAFAPENVIVWLNKIRLVPDLDYTTDGSTLILSAGASVGDVVDTLTISAVSMEDVKRIRDEALDAANKIKEAAVMQQTTFLIEEGKRIYQLYKDGRPVSVWEYGVRLFIAPYGPLVERQDYHILPDGRIELHHDFDPGSLGIADFMVRYTDSEIQQIILGTKENADRAEAAAADAVNNAPWNVKDYAAFAALATLVVGARYRAPGMAWDVVPPGSADYDFVHDSGALVRVVPVDGAVPAEAVGCVYGGTVNISAFATLLNAILRTQLPGRVSGELHVSGFHTLDLTGTDIETVLVGDRGKSRIVSRNTVQGFVLTVDGAHRQRRQVVVDGVSFVGESAAPRVTDGLMIRRTFGGAVVSSAEFELFDTAFRGEDALGVTLRDVTFGYNTVDVDGPDRDASWSTYANIWRLERVAHLATGLRAIRIRGCGLHLCDHSIEGMNILEEHAKEDVIGVEYFPSPDGLVGIEQSGSQYYEGNNCHAIFRFHVGMENSTTLRGVTFNRMSKYHDHAIEFYLPAGGIGRIYLTLDNVQFYNSGSYVGTGNAQFSVVRGAGSTAKIHIISLGHSIFNMQGDALNFTSMIASGEISTYREVVDHQKGQWSPVVFGETTAGSGTYSTRLGEWERVGDTVHFTASVKISAHTGTGIAYISLPPVPPLLTIPGGAAEGTPVNIRINGLIGGDAPYLPEARLYHGISSPVGAGSIQLICRPLGKYVRDQIAAPATTPALPSYGVGVYQLIDAVILISGSYTAEPVFRTY